MTNEYGAQPPNVMGAAKADGDLSGITLLFSMRS